MSDVGGARLERSGKGDTRHAELRDRSVGEVFEAGKKHGVWRWSRGGFELVFNDEPLTRREVTTDAGTHVVDGAANDTPGSQPEPCDTKARESITSASDETEAE